MATLLVRRTDALDTPTLASKKNAGKRSQQWRWSFHWFTLPFRSFIFSTRIPPRSLLIP
jgi:hypothetical protein